MSLRRVNAVETLYAAFPALMYIDPTLGKPLLEPQFLSQLSPEYAVQYAVGDLGMPSDAKTQVFGLNCAGSSYPNVTNGNASPNEGVERS
jgi:hypothetical protein